MHTYLELIYDLNDQERSIFLMYFVLKRPQEEIAREFKLGKSKVNRICKSIMTKSDFYRLRDLLLEAFC